MPDVDDGVTVRAKAVLVDPSSGAVVWSNDASAEDASGGLSLDEVLPLAGLGETLDVVRGVAQTGITRHRVTNLVTTVRGSITVVSAVYRLPNGLVLILTENAWQQDAASRAKPGARRRRR